MPAIRIISAAFQVSGITISVVVFIFMLFARRYKTEIGWKYIKLLACNIVAISFDLISLILRYQDAHSVAIAVRVTNFIAFFANYCLVILFFQYFTAYIEHKVHVTRVPIRILYAVNTICVVLLIVNIFYPIYYSFEPLYVRSQTFWIAHVPPFLSLALAICVLIKYNKYLNGFERMAMWTYTLLPTVALVVQQQFYGIALTGFANSISGAIVFVLLQNELDREIAEKENRYLMNQVNISISQIQPHFLYNALNTIQYLCDTDPEQASVIVGKFSKYLRMNMDSLTNTSPIDFKTDMEHLKNYLSIEKLRYPDIEFVYDIQKTDFKVPSLTLQPMVENAIRHGVRGKDGDKRIEISTYKDGNDAVITIKDNGYGFDTAAKLDPSKSHIGIQNTRNRIKTICGGTLEVESEQGKGTTIIIRIPEVAK